MAQSAIGIDLGGTNLKGIVMDADGTFRHLTRVPTEANKGGERILKNILKLIEELLKKEGNNSTISGVGIGTPGFVDANGCVLGGAENLPGWKGTNLYVPIKERFGLPARAANDVTVAALAESRFGAGRGVQNSVMLALGTGVGGGIVIDGKVFTGTQGMAGELGHISVETNGLQCNCGIKGCVEQYASATGIVRNAILLCQRLDDAALSPFAKTVRAEPGSVSAKMVYDFVAQNDPFACQLNEYVCDKLAAAIGIICNTLSPDRIILGGGVMNAGQIIVDTVKKYLPGHCWRDIASRCDIVIAQLSENAGALGAAALIENG